MAAAPLVAASSRPQSRPPSSLPASQPQSSLPTTRPPPPFRSRPPTHLHRRACQYPFLANIIAAPMLLEQGPLRARRWMLDALGTQAFQLSARWYSSGTASLCHPIRASWRAWATLHRILHSIWMLGWAGPGLRLCCPSTRRPAGPMSAATAPHSPLLFFLRD